ncbi:MAG: hypothetical protein M1819_006464 [Sarea resinae]|nr:MAG: hypothetical protein M1819_006464 [Sarea resinae]
MHALFNRESAMNRWKIHSRLLREFIEHFGPKTEQLDIYSDDGRVTFTSYTEKIMDGKEILKQPLHTSVAIDVLEFSEFSVEEKLHVVISVKDFKAVVTHADTLRADVSALYSQAGRPLQFVYSGEGILCEFTLMTAVDPRGGPAVSGPTVARGTSTRSATRQARGSLHDQGNMRSSCNMPPPPLPESRNFTNGTAHSRLPGPSPPPPKPSLDPESLFLSEDDDDNRWDDTRYDVENEDVIGWDASADNDATRRHERSFQDTQTQPRARRETSDEQDAEMRIAPTQQVSEIRGLFDD